MIVIHCNNVWITSTRFWLPELHNSFYSVQTCLAYIPVIQFVNHETETNYKIICKLDSRFEKYAYTCEVIINNYYDMPHDCLHFSLNVHMHYWS